MKKPLQNALPISPGQLIFFQGRNVFLDGMRAEMGTHVQWKANMARKDLGELIFSNCLQSCIELSLEISCHSTGRIKVTL